MLTTMLVVMALGSGAQGQARPQEPQASVLELSTMVERVVRLADLQRRKLDLELEMAALQVGESHPSRIALQEQIGLIDAAIRREQYRSYLSEVQLLAEQRASLEDDLTRQRRRFGASHPTILAVEREVRAVERRQREAAVSVLNGGMEKQLREGITNHPASASAYLDLAGLLIAADRTADAQKVLTELMAVLAAPRSFGR